ncbi:MAG TPA: VacB/RNase II family 3'-5' exoribonuclease [Polyangiaceae bacterium]|nr:VacB/RNase II family 3'-5' exoribonuclease [Polyangiaceae bacterium]
MARRKPDKSAPSRPSRGFEGLLSMNPRGFGFVGGGVANDDVYVPPEAIGGALHGDRVLVTVVAQSDRGLEGRIEKIVKRRSPRVAGVLRRKGKSSWLEPDDTRLRGPIVVSDAGKQAKDGDAAVVSITRFPEFADENPEGDLVSVLGPPGDPNVEIAKILVREDVRESHSDGALREAELFAQQLQGTLTTGRTDLRQIPLPTIDPEDARDHDDAVWVERQGDGYRAWIAIADVSEFVQPGSALDEEALSRGCTVYLPTRAIPMLPAALAADLCSLLPERERLCLCVIADLDHNGTLKSYEIVEGVMRSAAMLTYGGVARTLGFSETPPKSAAAEAFKKDLKVMDELTRKLRKARMNRGALDMDLPEARVLVDPQTGAPTDVVRRAQDAGVKRAYSMIEELMLLANEAVALWLGARKAPTVYRIHGQPDETKLERLGEVASRVGVEFDPEEMKEPLGVSRFLARIQKHERKQVLEMLLLRSLKQAAYDTNNIGHFGLASKNYVHFTSPIRRYPDVQVHRAVKKILRGEKPDTSPAAREALQLSATLSSARERSVMEIEREVVDLYRCLLMREHIGETFEGTVSALVGSGAFVSLDAPFVDVLIRYEAMGPDQYNLSEDELSAVGARSGDTISLGDRVLLTIEDVAILRRQTYGRRIPPEALLKQLKDAPEMPRREQRLGTSHGGPHGKQRFQPRTDARVGNDRSRGRGKPRSERERSPKQNTSKDRTPRAEKPSRPGKVSGSFPRSDATGRGKPAQKRNKRRK